MALTCQQGLLKLWILSWAKQSDRALAMAIMLNVNIVNMEVMDD